MPNPTNDPNADRLDELSSDTPTEEELAEQERREDLRNEMKMQRALYDAEAYAREPEAQCPD